MTTKDKRIVVLESQLKVLERGSVKYNVVYNEWYDLYYHS